MSSDEGFPLDTPTLVPRSFRISTFEFGISKLLPPIGPRSNIHARSVQSIFPLAQRMDSLVTANNSDHFMLQDYYGDGLPEPVANVFGLTVAAERSFSES